MEMKILSCVVSHLSVALLALGGGYWLKGYSDKEAPSTNVIKPIGQVVADAGEPVRHQEASVGADGIESWQYRFTLGNKSWILDRYFSSFSVEEIKADPCKVFKRFREDNTTNATYARNAQAFFQIVCEVAPVEKVLKLLDSLDDDNMTGVLLPKVIEKMDRDETHSIPDWFQQAARSTDGSQRFKATLAAAAYQRDRPAAIQAINSVENESMKLAMTGAVAEEIAKSSVDDAFDYLKSSGALKKIDPVDMSNILYQAASRGAGARAAVLAAKNLGGRLYAEQELLETFLGGWFSSNPEECTEWIRKDRRIFVSVATKPKNC